jgi:hypothetical protein
MVDKNTETKYQQTFKGKIDFEMQDDQLHLSLQLPNGEMDIQFVIFDKRQTANKLMLGCRADTGNTIGCIIENKTQNI